MARPAVRYVEPRPHGRLYRAFARVATTRAARWFSRRVLWKLDPIVIRASGGRLRSTMVVPSAVLETTGARSGERRRNAVIYFHDGDRVIVLATLAGAPRNPAWFYNARAHPDVLLNGAPFRAAVVEDESERARLWELADLVFPPFADYREWAARAGRSIPILQLVPR